MHEDRAVFVDGVCELTRHRIGDRQPRPPRFHAGVVHDENVDRRVFRRSSKFGEGAATHSITPPPVHDGISNV
jgi:hypothetical protein